VSFGSVAGESLAGRTLAGAETRSPADLLWAPRFSISWDPAGEWSALIGASAALGPNASAPGARTQIYGGDLYLLWRPLANDHGWPHFKVQAEGMLRRYQAGSVALDSAPVAPATTLDDAGFYAQLLWGFARPWVGRLRFEHARGDRERFSGGDGDYDSRLDALRDERWRASAVLSTYPSEFSKLRLQYNLDRAEFLERSFAHSVHLQAEIVLGAHGSHQF
jgi:hypothetical protein